MNIKKYNVLYYNLCVNRHIPNIYTQTNGQYKNIYYTDLYQLCRTIPWTIKIQEKRLKWLGHMLRLPDEAPAKIAFEEATNKPVKKVQGGQPLQWLRTVKRDLSIIDTSLEEAKRLAVDSEDRDREGYKNLVRRVRAGSLNGLFPDVDDTEETSTEEQA